MNKTSKAIWAGVLTVQVVLHTVVEPGQDVVSTIATRYL